MSFFASRSMHYYPNSKNIDKFLWYFIAFYTFVSAIRWNVGVDSVGYANGFILGQTGHEQIGLDEEKELAMKWIVHFVHDIGLHFTVGMAILAFLQIFPITKMFANYKFILVFLPVALFGSHYYLDEMNGVRQMIVASAFVYFSKYIVEKKIWKYLLAIGLSMLMHTSAIILLPLYFIPQRFFKIADKRIILLTIFLGCFVVGLFPKFQVLVNYGETIAGFLGYEGYADRISEIASGDYADEKLSFGPMMLSYFLTDIALICFGPKLKKKYENAIPYFNMWYFFAIIWGCLYFLVCNASHIFIRIILYFSLFEMVSVSLLLHYLFHEKVGNLRIGILGVFMIALIWVNISWNVIKAEKRRGDEAAIYKTFILHKQSTVVN